MIAFLAAMRREARPFLRRIGAYRRSAVGPFPCCSFEMAGVRCVLLETGVGRSRAAGAARALLSAGEPRLVVSFGVAGAPRAGLRVGDLVSGRAVRVLAGGVMGPEMPLAPLAPAAWQAAERAARAARARLFTGTIITTWAEQGFEWSGPDHPVLDMETAAIAAECAAGGVPLLALRSISDSVDEPLPFALSDYIDGEQQLRMGRFAAAILRRPALLPALLRLGSNTSRAADIAAAAVIAAVREQIAAR